MLKIIKKDKINEWLPIHYKKYYPNAKACSFTQKDKCDTLYKIKPVEPQAYCKNIPYKRQPA